MQLRFIDNTDPAGIDHQVAQLGADLASTLVVVISKVCFIGMFSYMTYAEEDLVSVNLRVLAATPQVNDSWGHVTSSLYP